MTDTEIIDLINSFGIEEFTRLMWKTRNLCIMAGDDTKNIRHLCVVAKQWGYVETPGKKP